MAAWRCLCSEWTFNELKRTPANKFDDAQLAQILSRATASPAGAYGARSVPDVLKAVYVATIELARHEWKVWCVAMPVHLLHAAADVLSATGAQHDERVPSAPWPQGVWIV